jgi:predicted SAM-dependent methyltransferase
MSTRLSENCKSQALGAIETLLSAGVKFLDCPLTDEEIQELWRSILDPEYVGALDMLKSKGVGLEYVALDDDVSFYVNDETVLHGVRFALPTRMFYKPPPSQVKGSPDWKRGPGNEYIEQRLTVTYDLLIEKMGREKFQEFRTWMLACDTMIAEIREAKQVVKDLFEMVKTSGQLYRMVPDLFQYIPKEQREALGEQKRASSYPFEWAAYDRKSVDRMMLTLMKCHLLTGSEKARNKSVNVNNLGHWSQTRYGVKAK